eukprot:TRINITY_DN677_c0_g1_i7.p1 TRINITY_DN677_c0_g1~~TRINITY_DN677_c0_g1_i7.p1  ORF type:complete len:354 (-),score=81.33 TRINITY_DN677_c0_g1_i7:608-1669(-)
MAVLLLHAFPVHCVSSSSFSSLTNSLRKPINYRKSLSCRVRGSSSSNFSDEELWKREEERWQREEQRWQREEARWLRQEARWNTEREALLAEISSLRQQIRSLLSERPNNSKQLLRGTFDYSKQQEEDATIRLLNPSSLKVEEIVALPAVQENPKGATETKENEDELASRKPSSKKRRTLRFGAEGDDVKEMQEALARLGFYSGEEDMEYSCFQSGTESAVKTWQATLGVSEDGLMTQKLLSKLFGEAPESDMKEKPNERPSDSAVEKERIIGHVTAQTKVAAVEQSIATESGVELSERRVYLLGENRWEEPQRLKHSPNASAVNKCFSCRGEGKMMCTECGGSGDLNVEEQV